MVFTCLYFKVQFEQHKRKYYSWYLADDCRPSFRQCCNPAQPPGLDRPDLYACQASPTLKPVFPPSQLLHPRHLAFNETKTLTNLNHFLALTIKSMNSVGRNLQYFVMDTSYFICNIFFTCYRQGHDRRFSPALPFSGKTRDIIFWLRHQTQNWAFSFLKNMDSDGNLTRRRLERRYIPRTVLFGNRLMKRLGGFECRSIKRASTIIYLFLRLARDQNRKSNFPKYPTTAYFVVSLGPYGIHGKKCKRNDKIFNTLRRGAGKRVGAVFSGRPQSFRHQHRPVDDCSPGQEEMAQDGGARTVPFLVSLLILLTQAESGP